MRKILIPSILFVFAGILFSSCSNSSKIAITKRHYRSGYYVDFSRRKPMPAVAKIPAANKRKSVPVVIAKPENHVAINTAVVGKPDVFQNVPTPGRLQLNKAKTTYPIATDKNISIANSNSVSETPILENKQAVSDSVGDGGRASERDALSLLWIVIVIILILWLIGIVAGASGLINLLLLIALILFILWLLRIW